MFFVKKRADPRDSSNATSNKAARASRWPRVIRNGAVAVAVLVAVYALLGFLVLPLIAKPRLEATLTQQLERSTTLGRLEFNPFTWRGRLSDFVVADRAPQQTFVRFERLDVDVSPASLRYLAPVFDAVRLVRPQVDIVRNADGSYNIDDLIAKATSGPAGPPRLFSINNVEVDNGTISFDDQPNRRKVVVSSMGIGIPFLSSLPHDAQILVTPRLDGAIDGARFNLRGNSTSPFIDTREATLEWNLDALPLPGYAQYFSLPGGMKLKDGALTTRLKLAFVTEKGVARTLALSGEVRVDRLAVTRRDGTPIASSKSLDVAVTKLDWLARSLELARVVVEAPVADLHRDADGTLEAIRLAAAQGPAAPATTPAWTFSIAEGRVVDGTLRVADGAVSPALEVVLTHVGADARQIASSGKPGSVAARFDVDDGAHLELESEVDLSARSARGRFAFKTFHLAKLYPYYASVLNLDVRRGTLDLAGDLEIADSGDTPRFTLTKGEAAIDDLETAIRGEKDALWRVARIDAGGIAFDPGKHDVTIEHAALQQGTLRIVREPGGAFNFARLVRHSEGDPPTTRAAKATSSSDDTFALLIRKLVLERIAADFEDRAAPKPVRLRIPEARATIENFASTPGTKAAVDATARIGSKGTVRIKGAVVAEPFAADWMLDSSSVDLVPFRPYFEAQTNVLVTRGTVGAKGRLVVDVPPSNALRWSYKGDISIGDFDSLDRPTSNELMRWKTLAIKAIDAKSEPLAIGIGSIGMDAFYARLILNADATLNLQKLLQPESIAAQQSVPAATPRTAANVTTKELPSGDAERDVPVSIGRVELSNGEVEYSDLFVQPNYNAHLTDVAGGVSALSARQAGDVQIAGRVESTAPFDVRGTLNPFAKTLQLDLTGRATDVDLPPLTPYSLKYAGYGIQKGKLSLEVHYRVDDRKLAATNKLKLDQLTFGEHVDSPTATKLPVLLAVSLLKDRNGVINLDLPIAGTLDDPKFSVWGVLVQIFVNLITKAVTAPFALLGAIAGGGGEQLAYIEFAAGRADLSESAEQKLVTLAKALTDRPGLKIDAGGRAIANVDRDGLKAATLERALHAQKQKIRAAEGESTTAQDDVAIGADEYPKLLAAVYRDTDLLDKPRNIVGMAKTIPPAEMEALLLASYRVDDEALATLANRRAQTVKAWLAGKGGVAAERVFVVAPKLTAEGIGDGGAPTRVEFAIR